MVVVRLSLSLEPWQYAMLEGLHEIKPSESCDTMSGTLRYVFKLARAYLQQLVDREVFDETIEGKLRALLLAVREKETAKKAEYDREIAIPPTYRRM